MENSTDSGLQDQSQINLKHSGLGIASLIISILSTILVFLSLGILFTVDGIYPEETKTNDIITSIMALILFLGLFLSLIGAGLAIAGLIIKGRKKLYPIIGLVVNIALFLIGIMVMIFGTVAIMSEL